MQSPQHLINSLRASTSPNIHVSISGSICWYESDAQFSGQSSNSGQHTGIDDIVGLVKGNDETEC